MVNPTLSYTDENGQVLPRCDGTLTLPLHAAANPRMYGVLTANTPGCVAFSLPVQRRNLPSRRVLRLSRSLPGQRRARPTWSGGFEPERRPVPSTFSKYFLSRDGFRTRQN